MNRRSQAEFHCLWCGFEANADENAARVIAERFGDDELNALSFRDVETVLATRFMRRHLYAPHVLDAPSPGCRAMPCIACIRRARTATYNLVAER